MAPDIEPPEPTPGKWDIDALWARVRERTLDADRDRPERPAPAVRPAPRRVASWVAAAALLLAVGAGALIVRPRSNPPAGVTAAGNYATSRGQYATVRLIEGSEVTLGPESRLTISRRFAQGTRDVALEGEAIFSVHHDAAHPFTVSASGALIQDVGTRFDLRAYPDEKGVTVAVTEGSVSLSRGRADSVGAPARDEPEIVLASGDVGTLDPHGTLSSERSAHLSTYFSWASGRLTFVDRPLPEVLRSIGRWYDLDVRAPDARLARRLVNAEFARQSPDGIIDALAIAMDATVERSGRVITLRPR